MDSITALTAMAPVPFTPRAVLVGAPLANIERRYFVATLPVEVEGQGYDLQALYGAELPAAWLAWAAQNALPAAPSSWTLRESFEQFERKIRGHTFLREVLSIPGARTPRVWLIGRWRTVGVRWQRRFITHLSRDVNWHTQRRNGE
jgi:hypothetical protein